jgi:predicted nucleotidyltransferase
MQQKHSNNGGADRATWHRGADVPRAAIRGFAREVAARFGPDKIVLFGSHAGGRPHADSDVDVLVVMPTRNQLDQAVRIELDCQPPFPLDLIVRTPQRLRAGLAGGDSFLLEIMARGEVLYEKGDAAVGQKGRRRDRRGTRSNSRKSPRG